MKVLEWDVGSRVEFEVEGKPVFGTLAAIFANGPGRGRQNIWGSINIDCGSTLATVELPLDNLSKVA